MGSSNSIPRPARASSCYLIRSANAAFALDFGSGAFAALRNYADHTDLGAIVISHMHADHFLDLVPLRYALKYGPERARAANPLPVLVPPSGLAMLRNLVSAFAREAGADFFAPAIDLRAYDPSATLMLGDCAVRFARTAHPIETYAMRVDAAGAVLVYSADTAPSDAVVELARAADLFICEATLGVSGRDAEPRMHSTAIEASKMAHAANVKHLILSHYGSECDPRAMLEAAKGAFDGRITVADDGLEQEV
ncbi:MAG: MBL fold metallo-hydrolase [Vulcanimicrobiaceae bacterium]